MNTETSSLLAISADEWWEKLNTEEKKQYVKEHPRSKYAKMPITSEPIAIKPKAKKGAPKQAPIIVQKKEEPKPEAEDKMFFENELKRPLSREEEEYNALYTKQHELEGLTPAARDPGTGKIYTPPKYIANGLHIHAIAMMPEDAQMRLLATMPKERKKFQFEGPHVGFLNRAGKFIPRDEIDGGPVATEDLKNQIKGIKERKTTLNDEMRRFRQGGDDGLLVARMIAQATIAEADAWWDKMSVKERNAYIKIHPRSKYARNAAPIAKPVAKKKPIKTAPSVPTGPSPQQRTDQIKSDRQKEYDDIVKKQHTLAGLRPALRDPQTGKIYIAPKDGLHDDAYKKMPPEVQRRFMKTNNEKKTYEYGGPHSGFVNSDGEFVGRNVFDDKRRWTTEEIAPTIYKLGNDMRKFRDQDGDNLIMSKLETAMLEAYMSLSKSERIAYFNANPKSILRIK